MGISDLTLYNNLRKKLGEQESHELVEFIHSEVKAEMETVKSNLDIKTNVFLTKEDKIDLIDRIDITKADLIDRIDITKADLIGRIYTTMADLIGRIESAKTDLIDRMNKLETRLIVWFVSAFILNYILLMITRKFF